MKMTNGVSGHFGENRKERARSRDILFSLIRENYPTPFYIDISRITYKMRYLI